MKGKSKEILKSIFNFNHMHVLVLNDYDDN